MRSWLYRLEVARGRDGWTLRVAGSEEIVRAGPFPDASSARMAAFRLVRRWQRRARSLGGYVWLPDGGAVGVALPDDVVPRGALPHGHAPCSVSPPAARPRTRS